MGTAAARLRKMLLFSLAQQLNLDICFKCGEQIKTVAEFTIEHKKPWLHVSAELFWDLANIAFSHAACNKPNRYRTGIFSKHGTVARWRRGCKCEDCCAAKSEENKRRVR